MEELDRSRRLVVALGGNAITAPGTDDSVEQDFANLERSLESITTHVERGFQIVLTHGNGPQVGNQMIRVESALGKAPDLPLSMMVADLQGGLGYMIEQVLRNKLMERGLDVPVCCLVTLVEVAGDDPASLEPTKFVGPAMTQERAFAARDEQSWVVKEDGKRGWRRVVASPEPVEIVESDLIRQLADSGCIVICVGGGGVPVRRVEGKLVGVNGVIDKDLASALLARQIEAQELYLLTGVEKVALGFGTPEEKSLENLTAGEARQYMAEGHFPAGSMGPKIEAACRFVEEGGRRSLITDIFCLSEALEGETGTWILPEDSP